MRSELPTGLACTSAPKVRPAPHRPAAARSLSCGRAPPRPASMNLNLPYPSHTHASTLTTPDTVPRHSRSLTPNLDSDPNPKSKDHHTRLTPPPQRTSSSSRLWRSPSSVSASSSTSAASASPSLPSSMKLPRLPLLPPPQATLLSALRRACQPPHSCQHCACQPPQSPLNSGGSAKSRQHVRFLLLLLVRAQPSLVLVAVIRTSPYAPEAAHAQARPIRQHCVSRVLPMSEPTVEGRSCRRVPLNSS